MTAKTAAGTSAIRATPAPGMQVRPAAAPNNNGRVGSPVRASADAATGGPF